ncbi:MAG: site-specific DNA-methyltransferase [Burkholderiales bacterium]|jgi:adenine-specific DNA-methyltransferase|nr:site-specific DNA-methyltransferase [Rhodocyclaceae bacterium]MCA3021314.1 site-specific DNA-methyltransferase [Rhodocyclaceae bacterium]
MSETPSAGKPPVLPAASADITAPLVGMLRQEMPHVFTDGRVDFEKLKATLGASTEEGKERYGLTWAGKAEAFRNVQSVSTGTLAPMPSESVDWDTTGNAIIEGDNLEVLKLLQRPYHGKVKMIYIDPPYNTGNEFIYPDNFREGLADYLRYSGQVSEEGFAQSTNKDTSGRYHSNWLSMMYPRLFLARNLLREDGVIFVSIDDHEVHNLRHLMDEVFGEENFVANLIWEKGRKNDAKLVSVGHEYMLVYARSMLALKANKTIWREEKPGAKDIWDEYLRLREIHAKNDRAIESALAAWYAGLPRTHPAKKWSRYKRVDSNGPWRDRDISWPGGGGPSYNVLHPTTKKPCRVPEGGWRYADPSEMQRQIKLGMVEFRKDHTEPPFRKAHIRPAFVELKDEADPTDEGEEDSEFATQVRGSYFYKQSQVAVRELRSLLGDKYFDNPKDHDEIGRLMEYMSPSDTNAIILDFFAGSGTTAQAVLELNAKDGGNRKFILVQLPEKTDKHKFPTIAHITRERVRRVIAKLADAEKATAEAPKQGTIPLSSSHTPVEAASSKPDLGFRAFRLSASNFHVWDTAAASDGAALAKQIELSADNVRPDAAREDLLYELILRAGLPPSAIVEKISLPDAGGQAAKEAYDVNCGDLLVCVETAMTAALMRALVARKPKRLVCLDKAFAGDDAAKTNALLEAQSHDVLFYTA